MNKNDNHDTNDYNKTDNCNNGKIVKDNLDNKPSNSYNHESNNTSYIEKIVIMTALKKMLELGAVIQIIILSMTIMIKVAVTMKMITVEMMLQY